MALIIPKPTEQEVHDWLLSTLRHSMHVEFYLHLLGMANHDPQRPHDITGKHSKYSWDVLSGLSMHDRCDHDPSFHDLYVQPAIDRHRLQYHHQKWNESQDSDLVEPEDLILGAIDTVCAHLERRTYMKHANATDEIRPHNPRIQSLWLVDVKDWIRSAPEPNLLDVKVLTDFPNIGISDEMYAKTVQQTRDAIKCLRKEHGYLLPGN